MMTSIHFRDNSSVTQVGPPPWFSTAHIAMRHIGAVAAVVLFPLNTSLCILFVVSYIVRFWGMEAVYHRYFSHRSYETSRPFQFFLALIGAQCGQRGPLWWAYIHRLHHRRVDTKEDRHSPNAHGLSRAYFGCIRQPDFRELDWQLVADFPKY